MSGPTPEIAPQVVEACTTNAEETAGALGRALDGEFVVKPGEPGTHDAAAVSGAGLAVLFKFGEAGAVATLQADSGLLPDWCQSPDPTGESKLSTLAQELSMLLMPDDLMADDFKATWVDDLAAAVGGAGPAEDAASLPIELAKGETLGVLHLVWPLSAPDALFGAAEEPAAEEPADGTGAEQQEATPDTAPVSQATVYRYPTPRDFRDLPPNSRSVLQVAVPVSVNLAGKKVKIEEIVELGPGSIITFDKSCEDALEITVGDRPVAEGDAVKVGEKFGIRVTKMILPEEHFRPMLPPKAG